MLASLSLQIVIGVLIKHSLCDWTHIDVLAANVVHNHTIRIACEHRGTETAVANRAHAILIYFHYTGAHLNELFSHLQLFRKQKQRGFVEQNKKQLRQ